MKTRPTLVSALFLASLTASPALASGDCVYSGDNKGSLDVFKFVKWEFGKRGRRWLKVNLTLHNNLKQTVKWFKLTMLADGHSISLNDANVPGRERCADNGRLRDVEWFSRRISETDATDLCRFDGRREGRQAKIRLRARTASGPIRPSYRFTNRRSRQ